MHSLVSHIAVIGHDPQDSPQLQAQKRGLVLCSVLICVAGIAWGGLYWGLGHRLPGAIPLAYTLLSVLNLSAFARWRAFGPFNGIQLALILVLPMLLSVSLGGIQASSAVIIWSLLCPVGSFLFCSPQKQRWWLVAFVAAVALTGVFEYLAPPPADMGRDTERVGFYLLNILGVSAIVFATQLYMNHQRDRLNEALEEAVKEARGAAALAHAASAAKSTFLATMSHEIRTPLNGVIGLTELALNNDSIEEMRENLLKARDSSRILQGVVNDIIDFSHIEAGQTQLNAVDFELADLLETIANMFGPLARSKGVELRIKSPSNGPPLRCDRGRLLQVFTHIIGNAVKFTQVGQVEVECVLHEIEGGGYRLMATISDTGIGIPPGALSALFEPFHQGDGSIGRRYGGSGLGLSIAARVVELMGGSITAESKVGQGSTFCFDIRLDEGARRPGQARVAEGNVEEPWADLRGARVLLVDDNKINRLVGEGFLRKVGVDVVLACDGEEALRIERQERSALRAILMDIEMPGLDGIEATRQILATGGKAPIIALTAHAVEDVRQRCLAAGMVDHVTKPIVPQELWSSLSRSLKKQQEWGGLRHVDKPVEAPSSQAFGEGV